MPDGALSNRSALAAYYTTSYTFASATTSTAALQVWRSLSNHLARYHQPMSGEQLTRETGVPMAQISSIFSQAYYQRHYGFRRFDSVAQWERWAREHGLVYIPELHDPRGDDDAVEDDMPDEAEDAEAGG